MLLQIDDAAAMTIIRLAIFQRVVQPMPVGSACNASDCPAPMTCFLHHTLRKGGWNAGDLLFDFEPCCF